MRKGAGCRGQELLAREGKTTARGKKLPRPRVARCEALVRPAAEEEIMFDVLTGTQVLYAKERGEERRQRPPPGRPEGRMDPEGLPATIENKHFFTINPSNPRHQKLNTREEVEQPLLVQPGVPPACVLLLLAACLFHCV